MELYLHQWVYNPLENVFSQTVTRKDSVENSEPEAYIENNKVYVNLYSPEDTLRAATFMLMEHLFRSMLLQYMENMQKLFDTIPDNVDEHLAKITYQKR